MKITEECKLCGGVGRVVILVPNVAPEKCKVYSDCPCCVERIWVEEEGEAEARIAELEAQQAVLVEALTEYMAAYNEHWERGMPILEPMGDSALAAVKPAGQKGGE